jgi:hypothetical protein
MPKQEEIITLTDLDTGDTMYVRAKEEIELKTVVGDFSSENTRKPTQEEAAKILDSLKQFNHDTFKEAMKELAPTGTALKFDGDKLPLHLLSTEAMNQTAAVLAFGAEKYAAHNWRKGFVWSRPLSAAMRHITAFNAGEDKDPESGLSHLAHAACCIMFLLEFEKTHKELDDRYKP